MKIRITFLMLFLGVSLSANPSFEEAVEAYHESDYATAAAAFEASISKEETGAARHNLALALYHQGDISGAVWQLERALQLEPSNEQFLFKLGALRQQLGLINQKPSWYQIASQSLSIQTWIIIFSVGFWMALAAYLLPKIGGKSGNLLIATARFAGISGIVLSSLALYLQRDQSVRGIILSESPIDLHAAPATAAPQVGLARPGERGKLLDTHNGYIEIQTEGGAVGWVSDRNFRQIQ